MRADFEPTTEFHIYVNRSLSDLGLAEAAQRAEEKLLAGGRALMHAFQWPEPGSKDNPWMKAWFGSEAASAEQLLRLEARR